MPNQDNTVPNQNDTVLWAEDDQYTIDMIAPELYARLYEENVTLEVAQDGASVLRRLQDAEGAVKLVVLDLQIELGDGFEEFFPGPVGNAGAGLTVARVLRTKNPNVPILFLTLYPVDSVAQWVEQQQLEEGKARRTMLLAKNSRTLKSAWLPDLIVRAAVSGAFRRRAFIVHGHDHDALHQLKNYLQNTMGLDEPIILHEQPNHGRTIIEKFEDESSPADLVFVLLTPDDKVLDPSADADADARARARQNVIFELGYFYGQVRGQDGARRVILLKKGPIEIPSDLSGILYIDISQGIMAAGEEIRKELGMT